MSMYTERPYPVEVFPPELRHAIWFSVLNIQAPTSMCAASALTGVSAASFRVKVVLPWGQGAKQTGLYILVVADSGERKSALDALFCKMHMLRDQRLRESYARALLEYQTEIRIWSKVEQALIRQISALELRSESADALRDKIRSHVQHKPLKPRLRRLLRQEITERAIMDALEGTGESMALIAAEGETILGSSLMSKTSILNKAWDGGPFYFDRKDRSIVAEDTRATASIMVQSELIKAFLEKRGNTARGSGFWARFLMAWPQSTQGTRFTSPYGVEWKQVESYHERINEILNDDREHVYEFDDDAKSELVLFVNMIEKELRPFGELKFINDFVSKAGENTARIAALFHHFSKQIGKISVDTLRNAKEVMVWYLEEAKRLFSPQPEVPQLQIDVQSLTRYLYTHYWVKDWESVPKNEVRRNGPVRKERFDLALSAMERFPSTESPAVKVLTGEDRRAFIHMNPNYFNNFSLF